MTALATQPPAKFLLDGLTGDVSLLAAVPDSHLRGADRLLREQNAIRYLFVSKEAELLAFAQAPISAALMMMEGLQPWPEDQRKTTEGLEDKYRFIRYVEKLENIIIHPGSAT